MWVFALNSNIIMIIKTCRDDMMSSTSVGSVFAWERYSVALLLSILTVPIQRISPILYLLMVITGDTVIIFSN